MAHMFKILNYHIKVIFFLHNLLNFSDYNNDNSITMF